MDNQEQSNQPVRQTQRWKDTNNNSRRAKVFVSFKVSVRAARAAIWASNTHWAADITMGDPGATDFRPTKQEQQGITPTYIKIISPVNEEGK